MPKRAAYEFISIARSSDLLSGLPRYNREPRLWPCRIGRPEGLNEPPVYEQSGDELPSESESDDGM